MKTFAAKLVVLSGITFFTSLSAFAQATSSAPTSTTPRVDQRQANQEQRIQQGVQSGQLTNQEAARLEKGQDRVARMEEKAKADGKVTPQERKRLQHAENVQSRHIEREKHDRQRDKNHDGKNDRRERRQEHRGNR